MDDTLQIDDYVDNLPQNDTIKTVKEIGRKVAIGGGILATLLGGIAGCKDTSPEPPAKSAHPLAECEEVTYHRIIDSQEFDDAESGLSEQLYIETPDARIKLYGKDLVPSHQKDFNMMDMDKVEVDYEEDVVTWVYENVDEYRNATVAQLQRIEEEILPAVDCPDYDHVQDRFETETDKYLGVPLKMF